MNFFKKSLYTLTLAMGSMFLPGNSNSDAEIGISLTQNLPSSQQYISRDTPKRQSLATIIGLPETSSDNSSKSSFFENHIKRLVKGDDLNKNNSNENNLNEKVIRYTVKKGDSLSSIARNYDGVTWKSLYGSNLEIIGENPNYIEPGMVLTIQEGTKTPTNPPHIKTLEEKLGFGKNKKSNLEFISGLGGNRIDEIIMELGNGNRIRGTQKLGKLAGLNPGNCEAYDEDAIRNISSDISTIKNASLKYGLPSSENLTLAGIEYIESGGVNTCLSKANSAGIMGLSHSLYTTKRHSNNEILDGIQVFDRVENIDRGTQFYSILFNKYDEDRELALTAYNQGETVVALSQLLLSTKGITPTFERIKNLKVSRTVETKKELVTKLIMANREKNVNKAKLYEYYLKKLEKKASKYSEKLRILKENLEKAKRNNDTKAVKNFESDISKIESISIPHQDNNGSYFISEEGRNYASKTLERMDEIKMSGILN